MQGVCFKMKWECFRNFTPVVFMNSPQGVDPPLLLRVIRRKGSVVGRCVGTGTRIPDFESRLCLYDLEQVI